MLVARDCSGTYGAPNISEQAPGRLTISVTTPKTLLVPVGTRVYSRPPIVRVCEAPQPPLSSVLHCNKVSTTSLQCGKRPAPVPAVGAFPPRSSVADVCLPNSAHVAPQASKFSSFGIIIGVLIFLWIFAGRLTQGALK